jgi:hypothetical protein
VIGVYIRWAWFFYLDLYVSVTTTNDARIRLVTCEYWCSQNSTSTLTAYCFSFIGAWNKTGTATPHDTEYSVVLRVLL